MVDRRVGQAESDQWNHAMRPSRLSFVKDPWVADWIARRLGPFAGQIGSVGPPCFIRGADSVAGS